jgi:hypothetical protein
MVIWLFAFFVFAHGVAHMVYTAIAMGWIPAPELNSTWTGSSWLLTGPLSLSVTNILGAIVFTAVTLAFAITAGGLAFRQPWANAMLVGTSIVSSVALFVFWDGSTQDLVSKGLIGLLINLGLLFSLYVFRFPAL